MKIKPESEISCQITLKSVKSGLFHTRYLHYCSLYYRTGNSQCKVGCRGSPHLPADILAADNYKGNELAQYSMK